MSKIKAIAVFGTRPETIKMAPLIYEFNRSDYIECKVCVTAQHRQMLDRQLEIFNIQPDVDLNIMQDNQTPVEVTSKAITMTDKVFRMYKPDVVFVHGDTATTFAAAFAAFHNRIKIGHVEAGLRTHNKYFPFPEEINRSLVARIADMNFAPTRTNAENLQKESVQGNIYITGNTVIDALSLTVKDGYTFKNAALQEVCASGKRVILVTAHRRENFGKPLENIMCAIKHLAKTRRDVVFVYPVHPNPTVKNTVSAILNGVDNILLTEPLDTDDMHNLMNCAYFVMTDSGGLQEEAPSLGRPVLVLRNETERPEAVAAGTVRLAGTDRERIISFAELLLDRKEEYDRMAHAVNPYGDGHASRRILDAVLYEFGLKKDPPQEFCPDNRRVSHGGVLL